MYILYNCERRKSGNLDEISWDNILNNILKYEGQKLCEILQTILWILWTAYMKQAILWTTFVNHVVHKFLLTVV